MDTPIEWQATAGGQIDADSHGDVNLGVRSGPWSAALRTDAPELSWSGAGEHGRAWVTARGHAFAAQLFISRWTDGAPDPGRSWFAASAGAEAGAIRYGPAGLYGGARVSGDEVWSWAKPDTTAEVPGPRFVGTAEAVGGWWRPGASAWVRAGADLSAGDGAVTPARHVLAEARWLPRWHAGAGAVALAPRLELHAGMAEGQDDFTRTRLGGLNPWVVPLAGVAWAEWWVEDYAAARVGGTFGVGEPGAGRAGVRVSPFVDLATFDGEEAVGFGLGARAWRGRLFLDATGGWAPWIARAEGEAVSVWFSLGADWGAGAKPADETRVPGPGAWPG